MQSDGRHVIALVDGEIDLHRHEVRRRTSTVGLTALEAKLLDHLARRAGQTVGHDVLLEEVWGYRAGVRSRTLQVTVRRVREKIEVDPSEPVHLLTTWGAGYRFEPVSEGGFVGRRSLLAQLATLQQEGARALVLTGPGGVGKTRAALHFAAHSRTGEVVVCRAETAHDGPSLVAALADAAGVRPGPDGASAPPQIARGLAARGPVLLVVDNLEHLPGAAEILEAVLAGAPQCRLLATSRMPVGVGDEIVVRLEGLSSEEGLRLMLDQSQRDDPGDGAIRDTLLEVVAKLDGLPLALELGAARLTVMTPRGLLARIEARLSVLRDVSASGRHAGMEAAIAVSWDLLAPPEQEALARLALWADGFVLDLAEPVLADLAEEPADLVEGLRRASLITLVEGPWSPRFHIYGVVRTFALGRLAQRSTMQLRTAEAVIRHAEVVQGPAGVFTDTVLPTPEALAERDNLLAVRPWVGADPDLAGRLAGVLWAVMRPRVSGSLLAEVFEEAAERVERGSLLDAEVQLKRVKLSPDPATAERTARTASALAREHDRTDLLAWSHFNLAWQYRRAAREADALAELDRAATLAVEAGDRTLAARCLGFRGILLFEAGDVGEGEVLFRRALALHRAVDDVRATFIRLGNLGVALQRQSDLEGAERAFAEAEDLAPLLDTPATLLTGYRGTTQLHRGELETAQELLLEASQGMLRAGIGGQAGAFLAQAARAALEAADDETALAHALGAVALLQEGGDVRFEGTALAGLGWAYLATGHHADAARGTEQALATGPRIPSDDILAEALGAHGALHLFTGAPDAGAEALAEARTLAARAGDAWWRAVLTVWSAVAERLTGDVETADLLAAEAERQLSEIQHPAAAALADAARGRCPSPTHAGRSADARMLARLLR